jgi:hypothetical protein
MKKTIYTLFILQLLFCCSCNKDTSESLNYNTSGTGGSLARFTVSGNSLYIVNDNDLRTFDISQPQNPVAGKTIKLGVGIETVYPYGNNLFIGSQNGMYIFDISNPNQPQQLSFYDHIVSCDPVVVQGKYAYVTLRTSSGRCIRGINSLDVVDISDLTKPFLVNSISMSNPHGLGIINDKLFVCEGDFGLKSFQVEFKNDSFFALNQKGNLQNFNTYDVIPLPNTLIVTGKGGLYQYDYSDITQLKQLSIIPVEK